MLRKAGYGKAVKEFSVRKPEASSKGKKGREADNEAA